MREIRARYVGVCTGYNTHRHSKYNHAKKDENGKTVYK